MGRPGGRVSTVDGTPPPSTLRRKLGSANPRRVRFFPIIRFQSLLRVLANYTLLLIMHASPPPNAISSTLRTVKMKGVASSLVDEQDAVQRTPLRR